MQLLIWLHVIVGKKLISNFPKNPWDEAFDKELDTKLWNMNFCQTCIHVDIAYFDSERQPLMFVWTSGASPWS